MRVATIDPITMNDVIDFEEAPYVIEGTGPNALKIYFESEASRVAYLAITLNVPDSTVLEAYAKVSDSNITGTIN